MLVWMLNCSTQVCHFFSVVYPLKNSDEIFKFSVLKLEQDTLHCNLVSKTKVFFFQMIIDFTGIFFYILTLTNITILTKLTLLTLLPLISSSDYHLHFLQYYLLV